MATVLVVAGEASGDLHAAHVIKEMKKLHSELNFIGLGGDKMAEAGVDIIFDPTELSTIGFVEALKHLRLMYKVLNQLEEVIKEYKPDVALLVDYSGFNLKVAKLTNKYEVPTVNYFAPSAWVWGKWRAKKMARRQAKIASVFPMEAEVYREAGAEVNFVGHPLLDIVEPELTSEELACRLNINSDSEVIGILPGSRKQEIEKLLPSMLEAAEIIAAKRKKVEFVLPVAETVSQQLVERIINNYQVEIKLISGYSYAVMELARLLLVTSGTATLEAACLNTPMVITYRTSLLTWWLGKLLVKIPYVGLPNIIMDREVVPEQLQEDVSGDKIAKSSLEILNSDNYYQQIKQDLSQVVTKLGNEGATQRVAQMVLKTGGVTIDWN
ncbi:lipid-A-disaccharide synthase [Sporohalobacter salinus]|uniref:lipid-A-disaccharide synthase n=1 Tax=Sporohalobacter salinus TaxID=1494606 RepID=UPI00195F47DE|nr:lipid-A-disaccharide synthase [Sporohalobacter salinus]MBM7622927.1 lipid-A-disaccharide synthase [Sporohalobacter salinus]